MNDAETIIETAEERRTRILDASPDAEGWEYDLALDLGYEPESWDGMWKLTPHPFTFRNGHVIACEVRKEAPLSQDHPTRLVAHRLPNGWNVIDDRRLLSIEHHYIFASPRDQAWMTEHLNA